MSRPDPREPTSENWPSPTPTAPGGPPAPGSAASTQDRSPGGLTDSAQGLSATCPAGHAEAQPPTAGRYQIEGEIARGGMGVVWRAHDPELNRTLAVKVLRADYRGHPELRRRFLEEAQITGQLQHPGIPPVHEVGVLPDGRPFLAMKLIQGRTLADLLRERASPADDLPWFLGIFEQVCQAVAYAHAQGVIHRDLKPSNIMVGAFGEVQVMDWGLAKVLAPHPPAPSPLVGEGQPDLLHPLPSWGRGAGGVGGNTQAGDVLGTPAYMAPEQARGEIDRLDARCDVFGLGGVLCAVLTGQPPFRGHSAEARRLAAHGDVGEPLARLDGCGADAALVRLAQACLAADREARPPDAGEVARAVATYLVGVQQRLREAERHRAVAEARVIEERKRRRLAVALAAVVLLLLAGAGGAAWLVQAQRAAALARQREVGQKALLTLERARGLLAKGWPAHDLDTLRDAKAEADRARDIADSGEAAPAVRQQAAAAQEEARDRLRRAVKSRTLRDALLDIAAPREDPPSARDDRGRLLALAQPSVDEQYAAAFRAWGLELGRERQAVARLRDEPEPALQEILAGLDEWMTFRRLALKRPRADWAPLRRLADELDRNGVRRELRALLAGERPPRRERVVTGLTYGLLPWIGLYELERGPHWRHLLELRGRVDPARAPALSVLLLARACLERGDTAGAEEVLRGAVNVRRDEVILLDALGRLLERRKPPRPGQAVECYRAVCARRPLLGIALGRALVGAGRAREGERVLRDLIARQPANQTAHFFLGLSLHEQGKLAEAEVVYREATRLDPGDSRAHTNLGSMLGLQGKLTEAVACFRKAIRLRPGEALAHANLGNALRMLGKPAEAVPPCREAVRLAPDDADMYTNLGMALQSQGKPAAAEAAFRDALRRKTDDPKIHTNLASVLGEQGRLGDAVAMLRATLRRWPTYANAHYNLGVALDAQGRRAEAEAAYREAIRHQPDFAKPYSNLGNALALQGKLDEAVAAYGEAIRLDPEDPKAPYNLGIVLIQQNRFREAEAAYGEAIRLKPDFAEAHLNRGLALERQGKRAEAEAAYREAARLRPDLPQVHYNRGGALYARGKAAEALAAYDEALRLKPDYPAAHNNRGIALMALGKADQAVTAFREAIRLKPDHAEAYSNLGTTLGGLGKYAEAVAACREAIRFRPDYPEAYANLGVNLQDLGKFAEALAALRTANAQGGRRPGWSRARTAGWIRRTEELLKLDRALPDYLSGKRKPTGALEQLLLADLCRRPSKRLYATAVRYYEAAFAAWPAATDLAAGQRYPAACAAALAGCGRGEDKDRPEDRERARLRKQALAWLRADLAAWARPVKAGAALARTAALQALTLWAQDPSLAAVRDDEGLMQLPPDERADWQRFWADVAALRRRAETP